MELGVQSKTLSKSSLSVYPIFKKWKGTVEFSETLEFQEQLKPVAQQKKGFFLGFESKESVITIGFRSDKSHILWSEEKLKKYNISQIEIRRGGETTLHAPGQLVIYPVLSLPRLGLKVKDFIVILENITQSLLQDFDIRTKKEGKYAGLYTERGKLCFFGIHVSGGVSQHGLSINVDNDLSLFNSVKSCGETGRKHDSLSLYRSFSLSKEELFLRWCDKAFVFFN